MRKSSGPKNEPWGTPLTTGSWPDTSPAFEMVRPYENPALVDSALVDTALVNAASVKNDVYIWIYIYDKTTHCDDLSK